MSRSGAPTSRRALGTRPRLCWRQIACLFARLDAMGVGPMRADRVLRRAKAWWGAASEQPHSHGCRAAMLMVGRRPAAQPAAAAAGEAVPRAVAAARPFPARSSQVQRRQAWGPSRLAAAAAAQPHGGCAAGVAGRPAAPSAAAWGSTHLGRRPLLPPPQVSLSLASLPAHAACSSRMLLGPGLWPSGCGRRAVAMARGRGTGSLSCQRVCKASSCSASCTLILQSSLSCGLPCS